MNEDKGCGNIACILESLLTQQHDITDALFNVLFDGESDLQILLFSLNDSQEDQIQLLMDFHEDEKIPKQKPDGLTLEIWNLLILESEINTHSFFMARVAVILVVLLNCESGYRLGRDEVHKSVLAYGQSNMMLGTGMALAAAYWRKDSMNSNARRAVAERMSTDPKQADKVSVRECWDDWQKQPDRYKGKAAFARDMLTKYEHLESQPVIEGWCRAWERES